MYRIPYCALFWCSDIKWTCRFAFLFMLHITAALKRFTVPHFETKAQSRSLPLPGGVHTSPSFVACCVFPRLIFFLFYVQLWSWNVQHFVYFIKWWKLSCRPVLFPPKAVRFNHRLWTCLRATFDLFLKNIFWKRFSPNNTHTLVLIDMFFPLFAVRKPLQSEISSYMNPVRKFGDPMFEGRNECHTMKNQ